jgi:hypothetical protein
LSRRRFFDHSSTLPTGRDRAPLSPVAPRSRSTRAITGLIRRLWVAIATAPLEEALVLRRMVVRLEDAGALHAQATMFETLDDVGAMLRDVLATFPGPLQKAAMEGEDVLWIALDAEVTRMLAAKARMATPPRFEHRVAFRKTAAAQSRAAVLVERRLAKVRT